MLVRRDFVDVVLGARLRHVVPARDSIAPLGRLRVRGRAHRGQDGGAIPLPAQNGWPSGRARRDGTGGAARAQPRTCMCRKWVDTGRKPIRSLNGIAGPRAPPLQYENSTPSKKNQKAPENAGCHARVHKQFLVCTLARVQAWRQTGRSSRKWCAGDACSARAVARSSGSRA